MNKFKTHNEVSATNSLPEGAYLLFKKILSETFSKKGKYPVPLINKSYKNGTSKVFLNFSPPRKKG